MLGECDFHLLNKKGEIAMKEAEQNPRTPRRKFRERRLEIFLSSLAGYDLTLLPDYAGKLFQHEKLRLVWVGASVFIPAIFGFFAASFHVSTHPNIAQYKYLAGAAFAVILFFIDSLIVRTLEKGQWWSVFIRLFVSVCIGISVSEPAILMLYPDTIKAQRQRELLEEKKSDRDIKQMQADIESYEDKINNIDKELEKNQESLTKFYSSQIKKKHQDEEIERQKTAEEAQQNIRDREIGELRDTLDYHEKKEEELSKAIDETLDEAQKEKKGKRGDHGEGPGPIYKALMEKVDGLKKQRRKEEEVITEIQEEIRKKVPKTSLASTSVHALTNLSKDTFLTDDEKQEQGFLLQKKSSLEKGYSPARPERRGIPSRAKV
jgi:hypothetical protein